MARRLLAILILLGIPTHTTAQDSVPAQMIKSETAPPTYAVAASEFQLKSFERPSVRADAAYAFMSNKTRLTASRGTLLQVVHTAPDGVVTLWFPHNGEVRRGRWHVQETTRRLMENGVAIKTRITASICFAYGGTIPNILGPEWQRNKLCRPLDAVRDSTLDRREGDVFGLADGRARPPRGAIMVRKLEDLRRP
jgi:hypothetical protein